MARRTHCKHGHEFTPENTRIAKDGSQVCRACHRRWAKEKHGRDGIEAKRRYHLTCEACGEGFIGWRPDQRLCSKDCVGATLHETHFGRGLDIDRMKRHLRRSFEDAGVPYGSCQCGCGEVTNIAKQSDGPDGLVNGEPVRFRKGHAGRRLTKRKVSKKNRQMVTAGEHDSHPWPWSPDAEAESIRR